MFRNTVLQPQISKNKHNQTLKEISKRVETTSTATQTQSFSKSTAIPQITQNPRAEYANL